MTGQQNHDKPKEPKVKKAPKAKDPDAVVRGISVTGYWATFPATYEEPKKFATRENALEYWPIKHFCPVKLIFRVWWACDFDQFAQAQTESLQRQRAGNDGTISWPNEYSELKRSEYELVYSRYNESTWRSILVTRKANEAEDKRIKKGLGELQDD